MKDKSTPILLGLLFALALGLRLYDLGAESFWGDEINMVRFSRGERPLDLAFGNALLYLPILRAFGGGAAGPGEFAYRLPAALFGAATVPLVYLLGLAWDGRKAAALLAALFVTLAPAHLALSQEAHAYAAFVFFVVAALLAATKAGRDGDWAAWLAFAAFAAVATRLHLFLAFLMPALVAGLLLARGPWRRPSADELKKAAAAAALYLALVATLLVRWVFPLLGGLAAKVGGKTSGVDYFDSHRHLFEIDLALYLQAFRELLLWRGPFRALVWAGAAALLLGLAALYRRRPAALFLVLLFVALPLPPITWFSWQSNIDFGTRRLIFLLPFFGLAIGAACLALGELAARLFRRPTRATAAGVAIGLFGALIYAGSATAGYYFGENKWDLRSVARLIENQARPGDEILVFTLDRLSLYHPPRPDEAYGLHELGWNQERYAAGELPPRLWVFWPPSFVADRFPGLAPALRRAGAVALPLGTGYQLDLLDRDAAPAARREQARELLRELIAIKGERPYLRARLATLALEDGRQDEALLEQRRADALSLRGRFPTRFFFFGL